MALVLVLVLVLDAPSCDRGEWASRSGVVYI